MATTYALIEAKTLTSNTATVTFSSIPATYTDLLIKFSVRSSEGGFTNDQMRMRFNGVATGSYAHGFIRGDGSGTASARPGAAETSSLIALVNTAASTSNTYSNGEIYIPNYLSSTQKPTSADTAMEQNSASAYRTATAGLGTATTAISSISFLFPVTGSDFLSTSSFYLYGISNA